jgi:hypothetical protein
MTFLINTTYKISRKMFLECVANRDSPTVANFSFLLHYTRVTTCPLFPRPFLFFKPKISVWMSFSVSKKCLGFLLFVVAESLWVF